MWVPPNHSFIDCIFHYKQSSYWGTLCGKPPYIYIHTHNVLVAGFNPSEKYEYESQLGF